MSKNNYYNNNFDSSKNSNNSKNYKNKNNKNNKLTCGNMSNSSNCKSNNKNTEKKEDNLFSDKRMSDKNSLDFSFVEKNKRDKAYIEVLDDDSKENKGNKFDLSLSKKLLYVFSLIFMLMIGFIIGYFVFENRIFNNIERSEKVIYKDKVIMDENIVFLGDSIVEGYDLSKFYSGKNVINSGISGYTTDDILGKMYDLVYKYNPSKVVILIGTNDYLSNHNNEYIINGISNIVEEIKKNRKYCEIYVQSVYPINNSSDDKINHDIISTRDNNSINELNELIKKMCKDKNISYINCHDILADVNGLLNIEYTKEGLHLNNNGYQVITKEIIKYID